MSLGGKDGKAEEKEKKAAVRKERVEAQKRRYEESKKEAEEKQKDLDRFVGSEVDVDVDDGDDPSFSPPTTRRRLDAAPPLEVPRNVLTQEAVQMSMTRCKISPESAVDYFSAIVAASGGKLSNYSLNACNIGIARGRGARKSVEEEKQEWSPPDPAALLWNEKRIERDGKEEIRMAVLVCGDDRPAKLIR